MVTTAPQRSKVQRGGVIALALLAFGLGSPASAQTESRAELIVMGAGDDVFSRFGHAALRIVDPGAKNPVYRDLVYNLGVTNFNKPNYIRDFLTGRVEFWGIARGFEPTKARYVRWDRTLTRHVLDLTQAQVHELQKRLNHDIQPEHRKYIYDTFRDNCATRLRDYIDDATGGAVAAYFEGKPPVRSFREDVRTTFANLPHLLLLTEIIPGIPLDEPRTVWELMYHPAELERAMLEVSIAGAGGTSTPLIRQSVTVYARQKPPSVTGWGHAGQAAITVVTLLIALIGWASRRLRPRAGAIAAVLWLVPSSLLGTVLLVVAVGTIWPDMQKNWLLVGFAITDLWLLGPAIRQFKRREASGGRITRAYLALRLGLVALLIVAGWIYAPWFRGPLPPRLLAAAGLFLTLRCLTPPAPSPRTGT